MHALSPTSTTILLISTSEQRRTTVAQQLERLGYSVIAIPDTRTLADVLKLSKYDLLIIDLTGEETEQSRELSKQAAELLTQGVPVLTLNADTQASTEAWTQETLGYRVGAALRNRNAADVLAEQTARWEGLNVLDPETKLFSRHYFNAIFPIEIERSKRVHQPMSLLLIDLSQMLPFSAELWQVTSARLLSSLRQTDVLVRYNSTTILTMLPVTEGPLARAVAARLLKTLSLITTGDGASLQANIGIAVYPAHGTTPETLLSAAHHALSRTLLGSRIVSYDQI